MLWLYLSARGQEIAHTTRAGGRGVESGADIPVEQKRMNRLLAAALACFVAAGAPGVARAAVDPADTHPDLHLIPWPKELRPGAGHMRLTAGSRVVAAEGQLERVQASGILGEQIAEIGGGGLG